VQRECNLTLENAASENLRLRTCPEVQNRPRTSHAEQPAALEAAFGGPDGDDEGEAGMTPSESQIKWTECLAALDSGPHASAAEQRK